MNPITFIVRRPFKTLMVVAILIGGGVFALKKMRAASYPAHQTPKVYVYLDEIEARLAPAKEFAAAQYEAHFGKHEAEGHEEHHKIVVTRPTSKAVELTLPYVCQIHSQQNIEICALEGGYLKEITVREGQAVKKDDPMFKILPILFQAKLDAERAKAKSAQLKWEFTSKLAAGPRPAVSPNEVKLAEAEMNEANAKAQQALAELDFTNVKAPFDGIVNRLERQKGSLIKEGDILTTLSDNSTMWVYFNVPEAQYLAYMADLSHNKPIGTIKLKLADGNMFSEVGRFDPVIDPANNKGNSAGAIEGIFDNTTGTIQFRADFANPDRLLRHGQTGTIQVTRVVENALVIPQRATFENLAKRYVFVVGKDDVVHQREIHIQNVLDDIFVLSKGLDLNEKIVMEGTRQVRDGDKVEFEMREPAVWLAGQKEHAE